jgi:transketolase
LNTDEKQLAEMANTIRQDIIKMLLKAGSGHSAGPLGMADVFTTLYFSILNIDPKKPDWPNRDRLVLSCGHICPVLYATLARRGYFPVEELQTLRQLGTRLHGHPHNLALPGLENSGGPLGQGLSQAVGMALAARLDGKKWHTHAVLSDGEHDEGQTWEAVLSAGKFKLHNLTAWMDRNNIQIDGFTENIMPLEPVKAKYESFGWHVLEIDGHNYQAIMDAAAEARAIYEKPTLVICHTIPGKGVDYMENDFHWHGTPPGIQDLPGSPPKEKQGQIALKELRSLRGRIETEYD